MYDFNHVLIDSLYLSSSLLRFMTLYRLTMSDQDLAKLEREQTKRKKKKTNTKRFRLGVCSDGNG